MGKGISVLIVDDSESYRIELEMILEEYGYSIWCSTASAAEAIRTLEETSDRPAIMLLDVRLKENINGIKLAELLKPHQVPFIFLTAYREEAQFQEASATRPSAYLLKPVPPLELHHAIQLAVISASGPPLKEQAGKIAKIKEGTLTLKNRNNVYRKVPIAEIYVVKSYGNFIYFYTFASPHSFHLKTALTKMEKELAVYGFVRVHRQYLINVAFWKKKLPLGDDISVAGKKIPIGRAYRKNLLPFLGLTD